MKKQTEATLANIEMTMANDAGNSNPVGEMRYAEDSRYAKEFYNEKLSILANGIYMANASRIVESTFQEPLTTFAVGWRDPAKTEETLEFVAPMVSTGRRFEYARAVNAEEWMSEADDVRAIGSDFKRVEFASDKVQDKTLNKGLIIRVDEDNVEGMPNWREIYTGRLMRRLLRNELRRSITLMLAGAVEMNVTGSDDTGAGVTWGGGTLGLQADPDTDLLQCVDSAGDVSGINANRILMGFSMWSARRRSYSGQNSPRGYAGLQAKVSDVALTAGAEEMRISLERYQLNLTTKSKILAGYTLVYLAESGQTPEDPSNIKRFVSQTAGGTPFRVYEQRISAKLIDISVEHYSKIVLTSTLGLKKITLASSTN